MEETDNILIRFQHQHRRFQRLLTVFIGGAIAVQTVLFAILRFADLYYFFFLAFDAAILVFLIWGGRLAHRRAISFVRRVRPRLRDAGVLGRLGPVFLFDNDLVLAINANGNEFSLSASAGGGSAVLGRVEEVVELQRSRRRMKTAGSVTSRRGPEMARAAMAEVRNGLGAKSCVAFVLERPRSTPSDARAPAWSVVLTVLGVDGMRNAERVFAELDRIRRFLEDLRGTHFPVGASRGPAQQGRYSTPAACADSRIPRLHPSG